VPADKAGGEQPGEADTKPAEAATKPAPALDGLLRARAALEELLEPQLRGGFLVSLNGVETGEIEAVVRAKGPGDEVWVFPFSYFTDLTAQELSDGLNKGIMPGKAYGGSRLRRWCRARPPMTGEVSFFPGGGQTEKNVHQRETKDTPGMPFSISL